MKMRVYTDHEKGENRLPTTRKHHPYFIPRKRFFTGTDTKKAGVDGMGMNSLVRQ
jgi:hypothetical protein